MNIFYLIYMLFLFLGSLLENGCHLAYGYDNKGDPDLWTELSNQDLAWKRGLTIEISLDEPLKYHTVDIQVPGRHLGHFFNGKMPFIIDVKSIAGVY